MGAKETVDWKMSADTQEVLRAWQQMAAGQEKVIQKMDQMGRKAKEAAGQGEAFAKWEQQFQKITAVAELAGRAIAAAYRNQQMLNQEAAKQQVTEAAAARGMQFNLAAFPKADRAHFIKSMGQIAADTGAPRAAVFQAGSEAASAAGNVSLPGVIDAVRQAARMRPDSPEDMRAMAGSLLDTAGLTGTENAADNAGFLLSGQARSRITNTAQFSKTMVPAAIGVSEFGDNAVQSLALPTAISLAIKDATGDRSRTASIAFAQGLQKFLPDAGSTEERIRILQQDEKKRAAFTKSFTAEKGTEEQLESFLDPNSEAAKNYADNLKKIVPPAQGGKVFEEALGDLDADPVQQLAASDRASKSMIENFDAHAGEAAQDAVYQESLDKVLRRTNGGLRSWIGWGDYQLDRATGSTPREAYRQGLEMEMRIQRGLPESPQQQENVQLLHGILQALERQTQIMEQGDPPPPEPAQRPARRPIQDLGRN
jgi:hypothetical protein